MNHLFQCFAEALSPFDSPENIRKPKDLLMFSGDQKGTLARNSLKTSVVVVVLHIAFHTF